MTSEILFAFEKGAPYKKEYGIDQGANSNYSHTEFLKNIEINGEMNTIYKKTVEENSPTENELVYNI